MLPPCGFQPLRETRIIVVVERLLICAVLAVSAALPQLAAQINGVPASVTSFRRGADFSRPPGVPASVTSLGPAGFVVPEIDEPFFGPPGGFAFGPQKFHHKVKPVFFPVIISYPYPYYYPVYAQPVEVAAEPVEEELPALTIFERRSRRRPAPVYRPSEEEEVSEERYGERDFDRRDRKRREPEPEAAPQAEAPAREILATLLIFLDGRQREVRNYAIMGDFLYDLEATRDRKVRLKELDVEATIKANEERGLDFRLPKARG